LEALLAAIAQATSGDCGRDGFTDVVDRHGRSEPSDAEREPDREQREGSTGDTRQDKAAVRSRPERACARLGRNTHGIRC